MKSGKGRICARILVIALAAAGAAVLLIQCRKAGEHVSTAPDIPTLNYEKYRLPNGLEVILLEDHRLPMVAVNLWYHVGPANEKAGLTGFAHLFEHMMFQGSKHVGDDQHFKLLEAAGASDINGTTDFDRTNYFETLPSNQLELALWLESDRMGFLLEKLDSMKLETQRDVVRNERRQSVENQPYGLVEEEIFHQLFPMSHPYHAWVIGSHADIEAARLGDVREFFKLYYAPNNASLAIVGDIEKARTKSLVEKHFGSIPAGRPVEKIEARTPPITSERRVSVGDQVELPRIYMAWITDPIYRPGDAECDLLARILGGGKSSRLYKKLVYEKRIAQDATAQQYSLQLGSVFTIQVTAKPGVKPEDLEKEIETELEALRRDGPTQVEVERARNTIESAIIRGLETLGGFGGVADRLNQYNHFLGDPGYLSTDLERYRNVTIDSLRKVAGEKLSRNSRVIVYGVPGEKKIVDVPQTAAKDEPIRDEPRTDPAREAWRTNVPTPAPASKLTLPVPKSFRMANGLTVFLIEQHNLPIVSANLYVPSGSETNPVDRPGLASFVAEMLDEGTTKRSALQIADDAEQIGASIGTGSTADSSSVAIRSLKRNVNAAFELLADVALHPEFPEKEIDRIRNDRLTTILQQRDNPNSLARKFFFNAVYGEQHPYGHLEIGTEESNRAITRDDLTRSWNAGYLPENAALVIAGDLTESELRDLADKHFGAWRGTSSTHPAVPVSPETVRRIVIVDKPGSPQTVLCIGHVGIARANPDYVPVDVMNTQLGGLFSSRINMNLREKNRFTYGAGSVFAYRKGPGPFFVTTGVRTDVTAPAVREIFKEIDLMRSSPLAEDELRTAKESIARSLPGLFETTPQAASSIGALFVHKLPLDYYRTLPSWIEAVTAADVQRVAQKYLHPGAAVVVAVGDRAKIQAGLEQLKLGPVEVRQFR